MRHLIVGLTAVMLATTARAVTIETIPVGDPGNVADTRYAAPGCGAVDYIYEIGKYEVTVGQYTDFLNAVATTDSYGLYNTRMWNATYGCCKIQQSGSSGNYTYSVAPDYANRPINYVSWGDAARFANWLTNGQPTGSQGPSTTEDGSYYLNGATSNSALLAVTRKANATWAIPTEDEWYKTAYYQGGGTNSGYWDYPTSSNIAPGRDMTEATNTGNNANYRGNPWPIDSSKYYTTVVGEFQDSDSPYGTFDQGGNIWEWNETILYSVTRGIRGGSFESGTSDSLLAYSYDGLYPTTESFTLGFRVARVPEPIPGDASGDGRVDETDATILASHWGQSGGWGEGDFNDDGLVGPPDASILAANWTGSSEGISVPEPGSLALLSGIAVMGFVYSRKFSRARARPHHDVTGVETGTQLVSIGN